ncbi:MAG: hypothetical protein O2875_03745 [Planctomycetota bacterium]|nr:hypothetical protein [Planctomycetota bacterium]MDA1261802.1 hypothetical protein [Planctomycetota bacterium]
MRIGNDRFVFVGIVAISVSIFFTSCNTLPTQERKIGDCGIALVIWLRQPKTAQYQYYTVDGGVFAYGAGVTALNMKTFWQTDLSPEQCQKIRQCALDGGWLGETPPSSTPEKGESVADIAVNWDGGRQQFTASGDQSSVKILTDFLTQISDVRFERALDRLPTAGKQPK